MYMHRKRPARLPKGEFMSAHMNPMIKYHEHMIYVTASATSFPEHKPKCFSWLKLTTEGTHDASMRESRENVKKNI